MLRRIVVENNLLIILFREALLPPCLDHASTTALSTCASTQEFRNGSEKDTRALSKAKASLELISRVLSSTDQ